MTFSGIVALVTDEVKAFYLSTGKRVHLLDRVGVLFDIYIEPLDAPGPDALVDPPARASLIWLAGALFDVVAKRVAEGEPHPPWPSAIATTETPEED